MEEIERWLSLSAAERGTQWAYVSRTVPPPHEASRGLYTARAPSQESVMRNKGLFLFHSFKDGCRLVSVTQELSQAVGWLCSLLSAV